MRFGSAALTTLLTPRGALTAIAVLAALSMAAGLFAQHVLGLAPCPLCVLQRVGYIVAGVAAAAGAIFARRPFSELLAAGIAGLGTLGGGGVAVWHNVLLAHPAESLGCGRPFEWFHEDFPLSVWLPRLFRGDGDCLDANATLFGLLIPQWSVLVFAAMLLLAGTAVYGVVRRRG